MTIECPRCGTLYRRPARPGGARAGYRCARCRHVFGATDDEPAMLQAEDDPADDDRFTFDDDEDDDAAEAAAEDDVPSPPPVRREARPARGGTARFAVRSTVVVALVYAVLSIWIYTHPTIARDALRDVPLIGTRLAETHLRPTTVQLANVHGDYQRVQGDRLVFVISGTAVNASAVPVRSIQVEGRIAGAQEQRQVVFCGAAPRDVHDLSLREIALLQTLEPPKEWTLAPGEQASFLVVFPGPPTDLREFGAEVVAVQGSARRASA
jgi:DNA-directed RNA polymerase subunit RPC12/RpoP